MNYVYLVLSSTRTVLSRIISRVGRMDYTHASISLDENLNVMYSFGRIYPKNPLWGGFVEENIHGGVYRLFKDTQCVVMKIPVTKMQYQKIEEELDRFRKSKNRYRYNFIGLFGARAGIPVHREKAFFCSQFVSSVLQSAGLGLMGKDPALITPQDLYMGHDGFVSYRGPASQYVSSGN